MAEANPPVPVIFGEVLFDCFEDGSRVLGGAPFNVAWHLQAFGCNPLFISRVGDDSMGQQCLETMRQWGLDTRAVQQDSDHPTGEVQVTLNDGQPRFEILPQRAYDYISADSLPALNPALIYHGSLGLRQQEAAVALDALLQTYDVPVFMDVNLRAPWWSGDQLSRLLDRARWVKINDEELEVVVTDGEDLVARAQTLLERHRLELVIVTQGKAGAFALNREGAKVDTAPETDIAVVDTVGAGDAFASVCIVGLLNGWPLSRTLQSAQQFASILVAQRGATVSDRTVYQALMAYW